ncbi:MAG TPA: hypothetical protein VLT33_25945, partial [Labilithrix sp.]|nr:hypothetical protein [Labilithrix sp.]
RALLAAEDDFTRALGGFDRSFRMRTIEPVTDAELRRFLGEQALDFASDEAAAWEEAIAAVARAARGIGALLPAEVLVVKTTGREERNHAYTRANAIFLPAARVARLRGERAIYLLAHELFHVASRASLALRDTTYRLLGFTPIAPITPPLELDSRRMTNPDAFSLAHYLQIGERAVMPLLTCPRPLAEVLERTSVLDSVQVTLLEIDPSAGAVVRDAEGAPVLLEASATDWSHRIGRNSTYTIHPEEVLADNFALLVRRRLGSEETVANPDFLGVFEDAVRACIEPHGDGG